MDPNGLPRTIYWREGLPFIDVLREEVSELLQRPAWLDINRDLAAELGVETEPAR